LLVLTSRRPRPLALAALLTALVWLGVKYAPLAAVFVGAAAWRFRAERRALGVLATVGSLSAAVFAVWHVRTFGGLTPYGSNVVWAGEGTTTIVADHVQFEYRSYRLYGLFLDARFGLVRWLPMTVLALLGIRRATAVAVGLLVTAAAVGAFASITIMGWWFPGRPLVAVLPALVALLAFAVARVPAVALGLAVWSLAIAAAVAVAARTGGIRLAVDPWELGVPLPPAWLFPDFRAFGARQVAVSLAWAALALLLLLLRQCVCARSRTKFVGQRAQTQRVAAEG
jgi:hypothetical protein